MGTEGKPEVAISSRGVTSQGQICHITTKHGPPPAAHSEPPVSRTGCRGTTLQPVDVSLTHKNLGMQTKPLQLPHNSSHESPATYFSKGPLNHVQVPSEPIAYLTSTLLCTLTFKDRSCACVQLKLSA